MTADQISRRTSTNHRSMCKERSSLNPEASSQGWQLLLEG
jgi:hypothetical protein